MRRSLRYWAKKNPDYKHLDFSDWAKKDTDNNPSKTEDNENINKNNQDNEDTIKNS
jgi:hypothetical protein